MTATTAGWLNTVYYATYTIGRLASIPLSTMVSPSKIIIASSLGCLIATIILIFFGINNSLAFFLSVGKQILMVMKSLPPPRLIMKQIHLLVKLNGV